MKDKIKILLKKEVIEFFFNYKSWLMIPLCIAVPYLPRISKFEPYSKFIITFFYSIFGGGQYIYDSYISDIKFKGAFFLHNIKVSFFQVFFVKVFISVTLSCILLLINIPHLAPYINFFDILWILPLLISFSAIMYLASVFSKGAEISSAIIAIIFTIAIFVFIFKTKFLLLQFIFMTLITCFLLVISFKISYSKLYRTQL